MLLTLIKINPTILEIFVQHLTKQINHEYSLLLLIKAMNNLIPLVLNVLCDKDTLIYVDYHLFFQIFDHHSVSHVALNLDGPYLF